MSDDLRNLYGVNLIVAILTRFPLLDEVHYRKEDDRIGIAMDFRLQLVPEEAFFAFKEELTEILLAFTQLEEEKKFHVDCEFKPLADDWWQTFLFIPAKEIRIPLLNMLVQWFQDFFHDGILPKEKSVLLLNEDERKDYLYKLIIAKKASIKKIENEVLKLEEEYKLLLKEN